MAWPCGHAVPALRSCRPQPRAAGRRDDDQRDTHPRVVDRLRLLALIARCPGSRRHRPDLPDVGKERGRCRPRIYLVFRSPDNDTQVMYDSHPQPSNHRARHSMHDRATAGQSRRRRSGWLLFAVAVSAIAAGIVTGQGLVLAAGLALAPAGIHLISAPSRAEAPGVRNRPRTATETAGAVRGHGDEVAVVHLQPVPLRAARVDAIDPMSAGLARDLSQPRRAARRLDHRALRSGPEVPVDRPDNTHRATRRSDPGPSPVIA